MHEIDSELRLQALHRMAQAFFVFLQTIDGRLSACRRLSYTCRCPELPRLKIQRCFGDVKGFPDVDQLACIAARGAPVHVNVCGDTDLTAALA